MPTLVDYCPMEMTNLTRTADAVAEAAFEQYKDLCRVVYVSKRALIDMLLAFLKAHLVTQTWLAAPSMA